MMINAALHALLREMEMGDVPDPLAQPLTLAVVWADLCRLAGEPLPPDVAALLAAPTPLRRVRAVPKPGHAGSDRVIRSRSLRSADYLE